MLRTDSVSRIAVGSSVTEMMTAFALRTCACCSRSSCAGSPQSPVTPSAAAASSACSCESMTISVAGSTPLSSSSRTAIEPLSP